MSTNQFQAVGPNRAAIVSLPDDAAANVSSNTNDLTPSSKWIPPTILRSHQQVNGNLNRSQEDKDNEVFRRCRALLNKLTPEKFDKLADDLARPSFGIDSPHLLKGVILLIFDKALAEPNYCSLYAELCRRLDREAPNFEPADAPIRTFRRLLLAKCEYEFENRILLGHAQVTQTTDDDMDPAEARLLARKKAIGNIKLIGELGKLDLVSEAILHKCLKTLLKRGTNENLTERCEDLECLTKILQTVGKKLDQGQGKNLMDQYLERIQKIQNQKDLPLRIKFILQDIVDLRANQWVPRLALIEKETKLTDENGNQQIQVTYKYQPNIPSLINPYPNNGAHGPPPSLLQRPNQPFHPSILQRPRLPPSQTTSDRYQFERLNPLSNDHESHDLPSPSSAPRANFRPTNSPKTRLHQHDSLTNPYDQPSDLSNGGNAAPSSSRPSSRPNAFVQRPKHRPAGPMSDREEMDSTIIPKPTAEASAKKTPEILLNHPLTKNMNNLSSLIKPQQHHHHHHHKSNNGNRAASTMTREELFSKYHTFLQMTPEEFDQILDQLRLLKLSKNQLNEFVQYIFDQSLHEHNKSLVYLVRLLQHLHKGNLINSTQCLQVLTNMLNKIHDYEKEFALFKSELATIMAHLIALGLTGEQEDKNRKNQASNLLTLNDLADLLKDGQHHPLFLLLLQQLQELLKNDEQCMCNLLERSRIHLREMVPESEREDRLFLQVLEDRRLAYLCPSLKLRVQFTNQLTQSPHDAEQFAALVEQQSQFYEKSSQLFIQTLVTCVYECAIASSLTSMKIDKLQEKLFIETHRTCLQTYVKTLEQQIWAIYALQLIAHQANFPKELLLRLFVYSYDLDIIEEDAYFKWKEDLNDQIPGKGKALFQVSKWLQWLEHASEESDEEPTNGNDQGKPVE